jgi:hypothetical protein
MKSFYKVFVQKKLFIGTISQIKVIKDTKAKSNLVVPVEPTNIEMHKNEDAEIMKWLKTGWNPNEYK